MGILSGFAPWIVYWVLVGNVPFGAAAVVALVVAVASFVVGRNQRTSWQLLEIGAIATFSVLTVVTFALSPSFVERWVLPLSALGILLVTLISVLIGKPVVGEFAEATGPTDETRSELFARMSTLVTWVWVAAFAGMAVSSSIPAIVGRDATILDPRTPLSFVCYWVIPFALLGSAALASRALTGRMIAAANSPDVVRRTTFVAFRELAIDELYYLAQQKAEREVGAGMEAYNVQVGSGGIPLTGDESRESWPATYKVRARR
ncbi:MAG TPA: hypothetical protein VGO30_01865 [Mycobacterium sp.]|jgi:hypothetical protein|nr:hypothetical protein [Mycobacterium sp.]